MGFSRARIALLALVAILVGASVAYAAHGAPDPELTVSTTQATSGEDVGFKIKNTEAYSTYTLYVETEVVARGSDPAGNGVDEKFKMPDLGSSEKTVTVEARVEMPSSPGTTFIGTQTMQYVLFPITPTGPTPTQQPDPVPLAATPASQVTPAPSAAAPAPSAPASNRTRRTRHRTKRTTANRDHSKSGSGGSSTPTSNTTSPTTTPTTPSSGTNFDSGSAAADIRRNTAIPTQSKPSGPAGTAGIAPTAGPIGGGTGTGGTPSGGSPLTAPITGTATVTDGGGFPAAALVVLALLALAAIAVGASRLRHLGWQRFAFAGPHDPDELRIGALARAARSSAETQQAIAVRKASRRT